LHINEIASKYIFQFQNDWTADVNFVILKPYWNDCALKYVQKTFLLDFYPYILPWHMLMQRDHNHPYHIICAYHKPSLRHNLPTLLAVLMLFKKLPNDSSQHLISLQNERVSRNNFNSFLNLSGFKFSTEGTQLIFH
jgi:hypothetical protein